MELRYKRFSNSKEISDYYILYFVWETDMMYYDYIEFYIYLSLYCYKESTEWVAKYDLRSECYNIDDDYVFLNDCQIKITIGKYDFIHIPENLQDYLFSIWDIISDCKKIYEEQNRKDRNK